MYWHRYFVQAIFLAEQGQHVPTTNHTKTTKIQFYWQKIGEHQVQRENQTKMYKYFS